MSKCLDETLKNKESVEIKCLKNVHTELLMCKRTNKDENLLIVSFI